MAKHANPGEREKLRVRDVRSIGKRKEKELPVYDATVFVGLRAVVYDAAIERTDENGEVTIELPKLDELAAAVAVARCLMPIKLRGSELRTIRRIMKMTLAELAAEMDGKTAVETVSRWEAEAQPMGGYAEKVFRLLACEELKASAPGIGYDASMISHLSVIDPLKAEPGYEVPAVELCLVKLKESSGSIIDVWNAKKAA
jgi:DNA-binding transcriptional regulator YiaG